MNGIENTQAIKYLRTIAAIATGVADVLGGTKEPTLALTSDQVELLEAVSCIEEQIDRIEALALWSDGGGK